MSTFDALAVALPDTASSSGGHLSVGGCDTVELASEYGTALFVFCRETFRNRARRARAAFPGATIYYASKAFLSQSVCRLVEQEGLNLDVASGGELHTALSAQFPAERMILHGNNKSDIELGTAIGAGIGRIAVDNLEEIGRIDEFARSARIRQSVVLRLTPGVRPDTHSHIQTGHHESKFGLPIFGGLAEEAFRQTMAANNLHLAGIHAHIGSNIFSAQPFEKTVEILFDFLAMIDFKLGTQIEEMNLGGGFGVPFVPGDTPFDIGVLGSLVASTAATQAEKYNLTTPALCFEPGRWLAGNSMVTLYSVGSIKKVSDRLTYVSVDGGMSDNIRPALYQAKYAAVLANKLDEESSLRVTLAGMHCESGDLLAEGVDFPSSVRRGDLVAMAATGAYAYSMSSNYNKMPRPAVVAVDSGVARLMIRRESYDDLIRLEEPE
ncbi:MAG: diaminopimelate decarboxylase [Actinomycetota bacterium]